MTTEVLALIVAAFSLIWNVMQAIQQQRNGFARKEDMKRLEDEALRLRERQHELANKVAERLASLEGVNRRRDKP